MQRKTVRDLAASDVRGRRVLVRVDFNVPIKNGVIGDDTRIKSSLPTIRYALEAGAKCVVLASHLGRPKGPDPACSLRPTADRLGKLMHRPVGFLPTLTGPEALPAVRALGDGQILVLHDLLGIEGTVRPRFVKQYARVGDTIRDAVRQRLGL